MTAATMSATKRTALGLTGVACAVGTLLLYVVAVRTPTGREHDNAWFDRLRDDFTGWSALPEGADLAQLQMPLMIIGAGVVCAACLMTRCGALRTCAALGVACGPGSAAVLLKSALTRPASVTDFAIHNSFPSGTVAGFAGIAAAFSFLARNRSARLLALVAWSGTVVVAMAVIRAHWHRPSDVIGAVLLALGAWALAAGLSPWGKPPGIRMLERSERSELLSLHAPSTRG